MQKTFITTAAALLLGATAAAAEDYVSRVVIPGDRLTAAEANALLPAGYEIGIFGCPTVADANGNWRVTPMIAKAMRSQAQEARRGRVLVEREVPNPDFNPMKAAKKPHYDVPPTITVEVPEPQDNRRGTDAFGIGDVLFTFSKASGNCEPRLYSDWAG